MPELGYVHFDRPSAKNTISEFLVEDERIDAIFRNKYVKVLEQSEKGSETFVGKIVEGPFYIPEEVSHDSAIAQTAILKGDKFPMIPNYYALARLEMLGEYQEGNIRLTGTRPRPKSRVVELDEKDVESIIGTGGNMLIGRLEGYLDIRIRLDEAKKRVLPRNIGIFGTVGSGKSNTAQVIMEEATKNDYAVVVLDVEGEYVHMDKPTNELQDILNEEYNEKPSGVEDFRVYYPVPGDEPRPDAIPFDVKYVTFDDYILLELVRATEAQQRYYSEVADEIEEIKKKSREEGERKGPLARKEKDAKPLTLSRIIQVIWGMNTKGRIPTSTTGALTSKFAAVNRLGIFDQHGVSDIDASALLVPGRLSVIDVSSVGAQVKNIAIVDILNKVFKEKLRGNKTNTLILIEEAHTFISAEVRDKMEATMDMLKIIARRGRKRWLCLGFISQQPSHLPNEIFELCNTRVVHSIKSSHNLSAIKKTTGGVLEETWNIVPSLTAGQALVISPQYHHPLHIRMRPAKSRRMFVE